MTTDIAHEELDRDNSDLAVNIKIEEHQYLTFLLNEDIFAVRVLDILEIIEYKQVTNVPMMQEFIEGVTNIRGNVVPVINLAQAFGMPKSPVNNRTCIVMVEALIDEAYTPLGIVVDLVKEVYDIMPEQMEAPPPFGMKLKREYIYQIGKVEGMFIHILNLETILALERISQLSRQHDLLRGLA